MYWIDFDSMYYGLELIGTAASTAVQSNPASDLLAEYFSTRSWIFGIIGFVIVAILHGKQKVTLFIDKTDALLTIFSPLLAGIPALISMFLLYLVAVPEQALNTTATVVYFISLVYMLGCSFKAARHANPVSIWGFLATCYARCFSVVAVLGLIVGIFGMLTPNTQNARSQFERDYMWAKAFAAMSVAYAGLAWLVVKLARNDEFGSIKKWLSFKG